MEHYGKKKEIVVITVRIEPDCFIGDALEFLNWRLLLARAAGYGVQAWDQDGVTYLLPALDYENFSYDNLLGIWDIEPEDVLLVLLAHSDEEGAIYPVHLNDLATRIEELLPDIGQFSQHKTGSEKQKEEIRNTEKFLEGLRRAYQENISVTFHSDDGMNG